MSLVSTCASALGRIDSDVLGGMRRDALGSAGLKADELAMFPKLWLLCRGADRGDGALVIPVRALLIEAFDFG